jgi:hypothetical protein
MATHQELVEQEYRKHWVSDTKRAAQLGLTTEEFRHQRRAATNEWTDRIRSIMDEGNARDPVEVLPTIIACLLEDIRAVAREEAETAARGMVQKMLKRAMVPL